MSSNEPVVEVVEGIDMDIFQAVSIVEGFEEVETEEEVLAAWQVLVDTGVCWQLQGRIGRTARDLIKAGLVQPAGGAG